MHYKFSLLLTLLLGIFKVSFGQTATNFTVNDCAGTSHDLFTELNSGKVIVLCWVMPCPNCVGGATAAQNAVQSFQASNPNRVVMYLVDDYANTTCASLNSWATSNGITNATTFSNAAVNMMHYGSTGMPKVVVVGGANHAVFYNANNSISQSGIQSAITAALAAPTGTKEDLSPLSEFNIFPNPTATKSTISFVLKQPAEVIAEIYNPVGQKVSAAISGSFSSGENQLEINTTNLSNGLYFVSIKAEGKTSILKMLIAN
jgi:hypothetical protein